MSEQTILDWQLRAQRAEAKLEAAREKLKPIATEHLVSLAQWLDRKFPEEKEADREVQDSLIKWAIAIDVARAFLDADTPLEEAKSEIAALRAERDRLAAREWRIRKAIDLSVGDARRTLNAIMVILDTASCEEINRAEQSALLAADPQPEEAR